VLEAVFILLEFPSPSRRIFIGSHSLPPLSGSSYRSFNPHIGDPTNLAGYPSLKPNIIFCDYLLDHNLSLSMDYQFKEDSKTMLLLKISSISPKEKYFRYLPYLYHLFARGQATSKHGGGGRYNAILEFKRRK
jgi:hypothetical protein